jgi:hypothetical protein
MDRKLACMMHGRSGSDRQQVHCLGYHLCCGDDDAVSVNKPPFLDWWRRGSGKQSMTYTQRSKSHAQLLYLDNHRSNWVYGVMKIERVAKERSGCGRPVKLTMKM